MISDEQRAWLLAALNHQPTDRLTPHLSVAELNELRALVESGREADAWIQLDHKARVAWSKSRQHLEQMCIEQARDKEQQGREQEVHEAQMAAALGRTDECFAAKERRQQIQRESILRSRARQMALAALGVRQRSMAVQKQAADMALADGIPEKSREYAIALDPELHRTITERAALEYQKLTSQPAKKTIPAGKTTTGHHPAKSWREEARAIGEHWMNDQIKLVENGETCKWQNKKSITCPGVIAIAEYVEGELSTRGIKGSRGKFLDAATIRREALTGITKKNPNGRK